MPREYPRVLESFFGHPWHILPEKLAEIQAVLLRRIDHGPNPAASFGDKPPGNDAGYQVIGAAGIIPIQGTISARPSMFEDYSGGTSSERIGQAVDAAANDGKVESIVLSIDSPGGSVHGMPENTAKVFAARKSKPVIAVANHTAASAAFWYGTQAGTFAVTPAGWVGSLGVVWPRLDASKAEEAAGVKYHMTTADGSPHKAEGDPGSPMSEAEEANRKGIVNAYFDQFLAGVAKGRGLKPATVQRDFGGGRMMLAQDALAARMVDRIATLEAIVGEINGAKTGRMKRKVSADMAAAGLPVA